MHPSSPSEFNSKQPKSKTVVKVWLPAFLIVCGLIVLILFVINNRTSDETISEFTAEAETDSKNKSGVNDSDKLEFDSSNLLLKPEILKTITVDNSDSAIGSLEGNQSSDGKVDTIISRKLLDKDMQKVEKHDSMSSTNANVNNTLHMNNSNFTQSRLNSNNSSLSYHPSAQTRTNNYDSTLLSIDLPGGKPNSANIDEEYARKAREIEEIQAQMSASINDVKQKNMQRINERYGLSSVKSGASGEMDINDVANNEVANNNNKSIDLTKKPADTNNNIKDKSEVKNSNNTVAKNETNFKNNTVTNSSIQNNNDTEKVTKTSTKTNNE